MSIPSPLALDFLLRMRIQPATSAYRFDVHGSGRVAAAIAGGSFEGPRLRGVVEPVGEDLAELSADDRAFPDVRAVLSTDDGARLLLQYTGLIQPFSRARTDASTYWRILVRITTNASAYRWLEGRVAIGSGRFEGPEVVYDLWAVE